MGSRETHVHSLLHPASVWALTSDPDLPPQALSPCQAAPSCRDHRPPTPGRGQLPSPRSLRCCTQARPPPPPSGSQTELRPPASDPKSTARRHQGCPGAVAARRCRRLRTSGALFQLAHLGPSPHLHGLLCTRQQAPTLPRLGRWSLTCQLSQVTSHPPVEVGHLGAARD